MMIERGTCGRILIWIAILARVHWILIVSRMKRRVKLLKTFGLSRIHVVGIVCFDREVLFSMTEILAFGH